MKAYFLKISIFTAIFSCAVSNFVMAQSNNIRIPGSADAGRVIVAPQSILPERPVVTPALPDNADIANEAPEVAKSLNFVLEDVKVEGVTAFSEQLIQNIYAEYIGQNISASLIWVFASEITSLYQSEGFFLSRAYVPAQEIDQGIVVIKVIEGHIGKIDIEGDIKNNYVINKLKNRIISEKPVKRDTLEEAIMLFNKMPGFSFESLIKPVTKDETLGKDSVILTLQARKSPGQGIIEINSHGSRYIGPIRVQTAYETSFFDMHSTSFSALAALPGGNELFAFSLNHEITLLPEVSASVFVSKTKSDPGFDLSSLEIESNSLSWGGKISWQAILQRYNKLTFNLLLDFRNSDSNILANPSTRDRIRALRLETKYKTIDLFKGDNNLDLTVSHGISGLGASNENDAYLSRASAKPDFEKIEFSWNRKQFLRYALELDTTIQAQVSYSSLFSSEEFGFGGPNIGRAYDLSEISGDSGISAVAEIKWHDLPSPDSMDIIPSVFYETGKVFNRDSDQQNNISATDAGVGFEIAHQSGINAKLSFAKPLTKPVNTPAFGGNNKSLRTYFSVYMNF